jgi:[methyl-Co(III) methanol-specific corrinoid protein]:coenzyme M methyltransferase
VEVLLAGSPERVTAEAKKCVNDGVDILAPGCGLAPHTPLRNLEAFVHARDEYYRETLPKA